ncbi:hypothetical protein B7494_g2359 [Chlorociboria aeruginascens]|nr:hypothetical protein B7494_g2359 [Chlorociboria aeruginascens]
MLSKQTIAIAGLVGVTVAVPTVHNLTSNNQLSVLVSNPSTQKVTSSTAFTNGAGNTNNANTGDGVGSGNDAYNCYYGSWESYPPKSEWVSFDDMWSYAEGDLGSSCDYIQSTGAGDSAAQIQDIYNAIQQVAESSLVDHRFIFATIMQESGGCVNVITTQNPDPSQPNNPGLMQSDGGSSFVGNSASASAQAASIIQMIIDGTQGTAQGDGLVQCINQYGNIYEAARCYNSGSVDSSNLNDGEGATASYVNDIANRMTGWLLIIVRVVVKSED